VVTGAVSGEVGRAGGVVTKGAVVAPLATETVPVPAVVPSLHITITVWEPDDTFDQEALRLEPDVVSVACRPWAKMACPLESSEAFPPLGHADVETLTVEPVADTLTPAANAVWPARADGRKRAAAVRPERTTI
jgi:hypothetical protein